MINQRCCDKGCAIKRQANEGYRVRFGFMLWACPEHAEKWQHYDTQEKEYNIKKAAEYKRRSEEWYEEYAEEIPAPERPLFQPSVEVEQR